MYDQFSAEIKQLPPYETFLNQMATILFCSGHENLI